MINSEIKHKSSFKEIAILCSVFLLFLLAFKLYVFPTIVEKDNVMREEIKISEKR